MGEMFWDSDGDLKMPHRADHSTITTKTEHNTLPAVFPMHHQPRSARQPFHQSFPHQPMLEKGNHPHYPSGSQLCAISITEQWISWVLPQATSNTRQK